MRAALVVLLVCALATPAAAGDGVSFRRTTPRAPLVVAGEQLTLGVPAGRAWGLESALIRIARGRTVSLDLAVDDPAVREGFVRIAWYERDEGRPRQMLVEDAPALVPGSQRRIVLRLDPPDGAVAFRVRVLARVAAGAAASRPDALVVANARVTAGQDGRPSLTRQLGEPP